MKKFEIFFGVIKIPIDFIMTLLAYTAAYKLRLITSPIDGFAKAIDYTVLPTIKEYFNFSINAGIALVIVFALGKMYSLKTTLRFGNEMWKIILLCIVWAMLIITYFFFTRTLPFSRLAIFYSWALTLFFVTSGRGLIKIIQSLLIKANIGKRTLLFIGTNNITTEINNQLEHDQNYDIIGVIGNKAIESSNLKILGSINQLEYIIKKYKIDEVIQTEFDFPEDIVEDIIEICDLHHINYRFIPDLLEVRRTNIAIETIGTIPVINLKTTPLDGWGKIVKRIIDILGAIIGFIILSPILLITAIAIKLDSKGPILFSKLDDGSPAKRVGQKGKTFTCYKFRSMKPNTNDLRYTKLADHNTRSDGPLVKIKNDPRVTRVGRIIRKYSIDELPQLWNVLIGNMSLVGPRPHLPEEVAKYQKHHRFVLTIKPGLSGIPQVSGRSNLEFEEEVKLDRFYIENWSILLDLKLIFKTISVTLKGHKE